MDCGLEAAPGQAASLQPQPACVRCPHAGARIALIIGLRLSDITAFTMTIAVSEHIKSAFLRCLLSVVHVYGSCALFAKRV